MIKQALSRAGSMIPGSQSTAESPRFPGKPRPKFDEKYPRISNPVRFNDQQTADLMPRLGFTTVGKNEVDLALSRTPADTDPANVASFASGIIRHWRLDHPDNPDAAAASKLLEGSASLAEIDSKRESARLAAELAEREHQLFEQAYHEFRSIPGKVEQLTGKVEQLTSERQRLTETNFDAKVIEILNQEYNPKPFVTIHESMPNLLYLKETVPLRLKVIDDLVSRMKEELKKLAEDNRRLAKELDLPAHSI